MSLIKTAKQIDVMREGGKILAEGLNDLQSVIKPNLDTWDLELNFLKFCEKNHVIPACKGYDAEGYMPPFPTALCVSINNQSVHCFPKRGEMLNEGDIITIDTVIKHKGMHIDASVACGVGDISETDKRLIETSKNALYEVINEVKPAVKIGRLSHTMFRYVKSQGFNVLRDYAGHGIGENMHEFPEIPCYGDPEDGIRLAVGMTICIEALVCEGSSQVDNVTEWETKMHDGKKFLQFEHTVLVTENGSEILTQAGV